MVMERRHFTLTLPHHFLTPNCKPFPLCRNGTSCFFFQYGGNVDSSNVDADVEPMVNPTFLPPSFTVEANQSFYGEVDEMGADDSHGGNFDTKRQCGRLVGAFWFVNGPRILQVGYEDEENPQVMEAYEQVGSLLIQENGTGEASTLVSD